MMTGERNIRLDDGLFLLQDDGRMRIRATNDDCCCEDQVDYYEARKCQDDGTIVYVIKIIADVVCPPQCIFKYQGECYEITQTVVQDPPGPIVDLLTVERFNNCSECDPQPPTGACCLPDGTCDITTPRFCDQNDGDYQGDDVPCTPDPCPCDPCEPDCDCGECPGVIMLTVPSVDLTWIFAQSVLPDAVYNATIGPATFSYSKRDGICLYDEDPVDQQFFFDSNIQLIGNFGGQRESLMRTRVALTGGGFSTLADGCPTWTDSVSWRSRIIVDPGQPSEFETAFTCGWIAVYESVEGQRCPMGTYDRVSVSGDGAQNECPEEPLSERAPLTVTVTA